MTSQGAFTINYNFEAGTSPENQAVFNSAKAFWEGIIVGLVDGSDHTVTITAGTFNQPASGGSITLGSAGPTAVTSFGAANNAGYTVASTGEADFNVNSAAIPSGVLDENVIRHEIGHVLGIGTLWTVGRNSRALFE